jgi:hypothetical protein
MNKFTSVFVSIVLVLTSCSRDNAKYKVESYLDSLQVNQLKLELARAMDQLPPGCTMATRWDTTHLPYYKYKADSMKLSALYSDKQDEYYFLCTRLVPSVREGERRAHIGRLVFKNNQLVDIEEYYWSNISAPAELEENAKKWLQEIVESPNHELREDSKKYMEWPNDYFYYDKVNKCWNRRP